jgi:ABC-type Fe3+/spermidine/putrescine transport system ATPase subunit
MGNVSLQHITKSYGTNVVLDDLSLEIGDGEFVSLLGPSGCGKTTLLRTIAGLQHFDAGRIEVDGVDVTDLPPQRRGIGMVFQQYSLFPNMTVRRNIAFPLQACGMKSEQISQRVDEMVELVGLTEHQHKRPKQLSGGQQQRVALARALAPHPRMLLLDEPLSALDAQVRNHLRDQIREIQRKVGITTIFVTHDQSEAFALSDRVVLMARGEILQAAAPSEIYARPKRIEAARFVGHRSEVDIEARNGRLRWGKVFDLPSTFADGTRVTCSFHGERVRVSPDPHSQPGWARATVIHRTYLGSVSQLRLRPLESDTEIVATVTGTAAELIHDDAQVALRVDEQDVNVYESGQLIAAGGSAR